MSSESLQAEFAVQVLEDGVWQYHPALNDPPPPRSQHYRRLLCWAKADESVARPLAMRLGLPEDLQGIGAVSEDGKWLNVQCAWGAIWLHRTGQCWIPLDEVLSHDWSQAVPHVLVMNCDEYDAWRLSRCLPTTPRLVASPFSIPISEDEMQERLRQGDFVPRPGQRPAIQLSRNAVTLDDDFVCSVEVGTVPLWTAAEPFYRWADAVARRVDPSRSRLLCSAAVELDPTSWDGVQPEEPPDGSFADHVG